MPALRALLDEIDDWCGTKVHPGVPPRPHWLQDLMVSIALAELASRIRNEDLRESAMVVSRSLLESVPGNAAQG